MGNHQNGWGSCTTIGQVIQANGVEHLFSHASFAKGLPPPTFVNKKPMFFLPKTKAEEAIVLAAVTSNSVKLIWSVSVTSNKIVPKCVAIVNMGQIVVKAGEDTVL